MANIIEQLHPEVQQAFRLAVGLCERPPVFRPFRSEDTLPMGGWAMLKFPSMPSDPYEILYREGNPALDHAIAHELVHLIRYQITPEEYRMKVSYTQRGLGVAHSDMSEDLEALLHRGTSQEVALEVFRQCHHELVVKLTNAASDIIVEQQIYDNLPGIRPVQKDFLRGLGKRAIEYDYLMVRNNLPNFYRWYQSMVAAQIFHISTITQDQTITEYLNLEGLSKVGERFVELVFSDKDVGYMSDILAIFKWQDELGIGAWFDLVPFYTR